MPWQLLPFDAENLYRHATIGGKLRIVQQLARLLRHTHQDLVPAGLGKQALRQLQGQTTFNNQLALQESVCFCVGDAHRTSILFPCQLHPLRHHFNNLLLGLILIGGNCLDIILVKQVVRHTA